MDKNKSGFEIYISGDANAGIPNTNIKFTTDFDFLNDIDRETREFFRIGLSRTFQNYIFGEEVAISFYDECPDCGHILNAGICESCPSNRP